MLLITRRLFPFVLAASIASTASAAWQDLPDTVALQPVGSSLQLNGTPMQIRAFSSDIPMETLLREVQRGWEGPGRAAVSRTVASGWTILNQAVGDEHRSFQVRQAGVSRVEGFVALSSPKMTHAPKLAIRLPTDITPVSVIDSTDQGIASQQVIAISRRSAEPSAHSLEALLKADGWETQVFKKVGNLLILSANKGSHQFDARLTTKQRGSIVMLNFVNGK